jgi:hypothetical protein
MPQAQHAGMSSAPANIIRSWLPALGMLLVLLAIVIGGFAEHRPVPAGSLLRWHDGSHDWLLAANDQANQLIVYDAGNGRPLRRLEVGEVGDIAALAQQGGRTFVITDDGSRNELRLPQLQRVASSEH